MAAQSSGFSMKLNTSKLKTNRVKIPTKERTYGLFVPDKKQEDVTASQTQKLIAVREGSQAMEKAKDIHAKALAEDPSVFDYDGVFDSMQKEKQAKIDALHKAAANEKSSRYISTLLDKSKIRERELDRVRERLAIKERKELDELYGDKEKFITSAYKKKLMEFKRWEEEDNRLKAKEEADDVVKQGSKGMASFYSNLLTKNIAMGGEVYHSKSAYTAGRNKKEEEVPSGTMKNKKDEEDRCSAVRQNDETIESLKQNKGVVQDSVKNEILPTSSPSNSTLSLPSPLVEKVEDPVAAAMNRYLERKKRKIQ